MRGITAPFGKKFLKALAKDTAHADKCALDKRIVSQLSGKTFQKSVCRAPYAELFSGKAPKTGAENLCAELYGTRGSGKLHSLFGGHPVGDCLLICGAGGGGKGHRGGKGLSDLRRCTRRAICPTQSQRAPGQVARRGRSKRRSHSAEGAVELAVFPHIVVEAFLVRDACGLGIVGLAPVHSLSWDEIARFLAILCEILPVQILIIALAVGRIPYRVIFRQLLGAAILQAVR